MKRFYYLGSLLFIFLVPTIFAGFYLSDFIPWKPLIPFVVLVTITGALWDIWATRHGKKDPVWLWDFNRKNTLGVRFLGLPIEEFLFYVVSSVYVVFMWEAFKLMLEGTEARVYWTIAIQGIWTLSCIALPYLLSSKKDKIFE